MITDDTIHGRWAHSHECKNTLDCNESMWAKTRYCLLAVPLLHHANSRSARLCNYMGDGERSNRRGQGCTVKREVRRQVLHKDWNNSRELSSEKSLRLTNGRTTRQMACVSDSREQNKKTTNDVFRTITQDHLLTITAAQSQIHRTGCLSFRRKKNIASLRRYASSLIHQYTLDCNRSVHVQQKGQ